MRRDGREWKVGLVLLAALGVLGAAILVIGDRSQLFSRKNRYFVEFGSVSGLKEGNPVQLNGVTVGDVERIDLPVDPQVEVIRVWVTIGRNYADRLRSQDGPPLAGLAGPLPRSQARIKTLGLLGDKYIEITSGASEYPAIPSGGRIPSAKPTNVDALVASGEDVMSNVVEISHSLSSILGRMERGQGLLGEMTTDSAPGRRLRESLVGTMEGIERITARVEGGEGALPRLLNDPVLAERLVASVDRLEKVIAAADEGEGLLPAMLKDQGPKQSVEETLADLRAAAASLKSATANLETREGLVPRLLNDEEYGRQVTDQLQQLIERLNDLSLRLTQGEGTAARLINDPQVYEAVDDILVGVEESKFLRWLIRNRQKKGIKKRYDEAQREAPSESREAPPAVGAPAPPPLSPEPETAPAVAVEPAPTEPAAPAESTPQPPPTARRGAAR